MSSATRSCTCARSRCDGDYVRPCVRRCGDGLCHRLAGGERSRSAGRVRPRKRELSWSTAAKPNVIVTVQPSAVVVEVDDRLEAIQSTFPLENLGTANFRIGVGRQELGSSPSFFSIFETLGNDIFVTLEPRKPRTFSIRYGGHPRRRRARTRASFMWPASLFRSFPAAPWSCLHPRPHRGTPAWRSESATPAPRHGTGSRTKTRFPAGGCDATVRQMRRARRCSLSRWRPIITRRFGNRCSWTSCRNRAQPVRKPGELLAHGGDLE